MSAVIIDIVTGVIQKLRGKRADWTAEKIAAAVADKATEALVTVIAAEMHKYAAALGVVLATHEAAEATQHVLEAMRVQPGHSFGALPAEEAKPGEKLVDGKWVDTGATTGSGGGEGGP